MVLLTLSVSVIPLDYRKAIFFVALYILSVGEGGHKPCVQTFAADQFDEDSLEDKKVKSSFFNWWFFGIVAGSSAAILAVIYVEVKICGKYYTWLLTNEKLTKCVEVKICGKFVNISLYYKKLTKLCCNECYYFHFNKKKKKKKKIKLIQILLYKTNIVKFVVLF